MGKAIGQRIAALEQKGVKFVGGTDNITEETLGQLELRQEIDEQELRDDLRAERHQQIQKATDDLRDDGNYEWLLDAPPTKKWWNVQEVSFEMGVPESTVRGWCKDGRIPGAINHGKRVGWRMPRTGLILLFGNYENAAEDDSDEDEEEE